MIHRTAAVTARALEIALRGESFQVDDVRRGLADPPSRQTIYRVLRQLETDDWITQRGNGWHPDVKAQLLAGDREGDDVGQNDRRGRGGPLVDVGDIL